MPPRAIGDTPATRECAGKACEALLWTLGADPRVKRAYAAWLASPPGRRDHGIIDRLVRDELALSYSWLPRLLLMAFAASAYWELTGEVRHVRVTPAELPPGRRAKHEGQHILRDVEWYYRAKIQSPPTPKRKLAAEYQRAVGRTTDARSVVQTGIRRAEQLLSIFDSVI